MRSIQPVSVFCPRIFNSFFTFLLLMGGCFGFCATAGAQDSGSFQLVTGHGIFGGTTDTSKACHSGVVARHTRQGNSYSTFFISSQLVSPELFSNDDTLPREIVEKMRMTKAPRVRTLGISGDRGELLANFSELPTRSEVWFVARHVVESLNSAPRLALPPRLLEYNIYDLLTPQNELLDLLIVAHPQYTAEQILESLKSFGAQQARGLQNKIWASWQLRDLTQINNVSCLNAIYNYGSFTVSSRLEASRAYLSLNGLDYAAQGSSGSLIWATGKSGPVSWEPAGIVECLKLDPVSRQPVGTRLLPASLIARASLRKVERKDLISESQRYVDDSCRPIGKRRGGGQ